MSVNRFFVSVSLTAIFSMAATPSVSQNNAAVLREILEKVEAFKTETMALQNELQTERERALVLEARIEKLEKEGDSSSVPSIPVGAVMAFDTDPKTEPGCPAGWEFFEPAGGRMIVGAGDHNNRWFQRDSSEPLPISIYPTFEQDARAGVQETDEARATGGAESVSITVAQLPPHNHGLEHGLNGQQLPWYAQAKSYPVPIGVAHSGSEYDWSSGSGEGHPNMPPFIALYYCKKK
ncbi:hypothetical protein [Parasedimentitalea huanghaiensis]|uniref:Uncharacterized protein n=1 Tax=Parasedimentitalea huanghaiensis TaxID=2682100 RepID=A0A6L6WJW5_9RHOB|nr:hypothetical protein [Zongyanglinia huanghaiensis]MVO16845.1 hypothetical protein [Zongyanglinia huanghaiensis]